MLARVRSIALVGTSGHPVWVEVNVADQGLPGLKIVGLAARCVNESDQRIRSAIEATGSFRWPQRRMVANLAPSDLRKEGSHLDLALALGILGGNKQFDASRLDGWVVMGELGLDGTVRGVPGVLAAATTAKRLKMKGIVCPAANGPEAAIVEGIRVVPVPDLASVISFFEGSWHPPDVIAADEEPAPVEDMADVRGQHGARYAIELAAAGGHNLLLVGPPGSGKSMLARRMPGILPAMSRGEALEVTQVFSVAGMLPERASLISQRPFRSPHQGTTLAALVGGGTGLPRPGEISLAHHGVLFLDEIALFRSDVLESLRSPLEDGTIRIARSGGVVTYPCRFSLVAAMNPCPCGYAGDDTRPCVCAEYRMRLYNERLSGPLLDRFDIQSVLQRPTRAELMSEESGEPSAAIRERVEAARGIQTERYGTALITNASCSKFTLEQTVRMTKEARRALGSMIETYRLSGRSVDRIKRLARTLADLRARDEVTDDEIGAALMHRFQEPQAVPA